MFAQKNAASSRTIQKATQTDSAQTENATILTSQPGRRGVESKERADKSTNPNPWAGQPSAPVGKQQRSIDRVLDELTWRAQPVKVETRARMRHSHPDAASVIKVRGKINQIVYGPR
ncbi:hypothetical protein ASPCADRAFT_205361 [Aspergillus carbonarius ITEM 5010]|uniref:Uncharacterized protein n=1 Tax=Aspergillus carbonarius (strain ITEM 5010) TaxID=602072 RepID=A0A1R3RUH2_ASPC5|nr:hypothetical protein ASPCADRAFT_205361 [Aspergillus carbonarius ITEM 5010]